MPQLTAPIYRRDYKGETITYVDNAEMKSLFVAPREFPYDRSVTNSVVLGNGISRLDPNIQLLLNQNNKRVAEGYKTTYACNAAYRDTKADYYIWKTNIFFGDKTYPVETSKIFLQNNLWVNYRDTNLIPNIWYMDSGSTAAFLAAFDGAKKIFLFGFDGCGDVHKNIYENTLGYDDLNLNYNKHNAHLTNVCAAYTDVQFYRVRTEVCFDYSYELNDLPNYHEISIRQAVLEGDF